MAEKIVTAKGYVIISVSNETKNENRMKQQKNFCESYKPCEDFKLIPIPWNTGIDQSTRETILQKI